MGNLFSRFFSPRPDQLRKGEEIGTGAYGVVLEGTLGTRPVAIKQVHRILSDYASVTQEGLEVTLEAFRRECDLLEKAKSPHIVELVGVYDEEDSVLLLMELMHQTLDQYLKDHKGRLPLEKQLDICYQVSCGLLFLHQYNPQILHRDLTAKNILLNEDGSIVKISDFGQAKFRPSNIQYLSTKAPGCVVYMPPECFGDRPRFTAESDTFSFSVVMLDVFTQEPPSCGLINIGAKPEIERRADDLSKLSDDHPLKSLIVACLDDDPNKRPDMRKVQSILGSVLAVENLQKTGNSDCIEGYQELKSELSKDEKNQQDDEIDRQNLLSQVESLREQVRLKEEETESAKNQMEEMSQQQTSMLTGMAREREMNKEALTQAKRNIAQLKAPCSNAGDLCNVRAMYSGPLAHEAELEKLCWIPFGIQILTVGEEGGLFPLQPQTTEVYEDNDVIALEVPEGAVNTAVCDRLCIRYGVIVYGPFDLPEGYQLCSMAVYIYFNQEHAVKPVVLHLPHWSGKDGESGLKCVVAPHRLEEGEEKCKFNIVEEGGSKSREGRDLIIIDGHCSLFAKALKQKASLKYYASGLEKEVKDGTNLYVLITYASQIWLQILKRHRSVVSSHVIFEFNSNCIQGRITSGGGKGWEAHLNANNVVHKEDVEYSSHGIEEPSDMEGAVMRRAYPPFISCQTTYSKKLKKSGEPTKVSLVVEGAKDKSMNFLCPAYKYKNTGSPKRTPSPTPELVDRTELENGQASSIDRTPSVSPTSSGPQSLLTNRPSKELRVQHLMPYILDLAACGLGIAGYLGLTTAWASIEISLKDPPGRLQELLTKWLDDSEQETSPHSWEFFVDVVRKVGKGKLADRIVQEIFTEPQDSGSKCPPSSVERVVWTDPQSKATTEVEENGHFNGH